MLIVMCDIINKMSMEFCIKPWTDDLGTKMEALFKQNRLFTTYYATTQDNYYLHIDVWILKWVKYVNINVFEN